MKPITSLCTAFVLALLVFVRPSLGQGTFGMFPNPISHSELMEYADLLRLSSDQRTALQDPHDLYLASMRDLRTSDINAAMGEMLQFVGTVPTVEQYESFQRQQRKVITKIGQQDNELFDAISGLLTDDQLQFMTRVRNRRERERLASVLTTGNMILDSRSLIDLSSLLKRVTMTDAEQASVESILMEYETALTNHYRRLWIVSQKSNQAIVEALAELNPEMSEPVTDGDAFWEFMTTLQNVAEKVHDDYKDDIARTNEINESAVRRMWEVLPASTGNRIRFVYFRRAHYGVVGSEIRIYQELLRVNRLENLDPEVQAQVDALREQFLSTSDAAIDRMVRLDKKTAGESQFNWFDNEEPSEDRDRKEALRETQDEYLNEVRADLKAILGDRWEDFERLPKRNLDEEEPFLEIVEEFSDDGSMVVVVEGDEATPMPEDSTTVVMGRTGVDPDDHDHGHEGEPMSVSSESDDPYPDDIAPDNSRQRGQGGSRGAPSLSEIAAMLPQPMSREDVGRLVNSMNLEETERELLQGLYLDYREEFKNYRNTKVMPFAGQLIGVAIALGAGNLLSEDQLRRLFRDGRATFDGMLDIDRVYFENVAVVLGVEPDVFPLRQAQLRRTFSLYIPEQLSEGLRRNGMGFAGSAEFTVNIADVVADLELSDQEMASLEGPLLAYHEEMGATVTLSWNQLLDAVLELAVLARNVYEENMGEERPDPRQLVSLFLEHQDKLGALLDQATDSLKMLSAVNISHIDEVSKALPDEKQDTFKLLYKKTSFPHIYERGDGTIRATMVRAKQLQSITPTQLSELSQLIAEYTATEYEICDQMIELNRKGAPMPLGGILGVAGANQGLQGFMVYEQNRQQLEFDRDNLDQRTRDQMTKIFSDAQIHQLSLSRDN